MHKYTNWAMFSHSSLDRAHSLPKINCVDIMQQSAQLYRDGDAAVLLCIDFNVTCPWCHWELAFRFKQRLPRWRQKTLWRWHRRREQGCSVTFSCYNFLKVGLFNFFFLSQTQNCWKGENAQHWKAKTISGEERQQTLPQAQGKVSNAHLVMVLNGMLWTGLFHTEREIQSDRSRWEPIQRLNE